MTAINSKPKWIRKHIGLAKYEVILITEYKF